MMLYLGEVKPMGHYGDCAFVLWLAYLLLLWSAFCPS
jgi:hypothetical protein